MFNTSTEFTNFLIHSYRNGNDRAFDTLVREHQDLINRITRKFFFVDDVETVALEGFWYAAKNYKFDVGTFSGYAWECMRLHIVDAFNSFRSSMCVKKGMLEYADALRKAEEKLAKAGVFFPSDEILMKVAGIESKKTFNHAQRVREFLDLKELDRPMGDDSESSFGDSVSSSYSLEEEFLAKEFAHFLLGRVSSLSDKRDREILIGGMKGEKNSSLMEKTGWSEPTLIAHRKKVYEDLKESLLEGGWVA